MKRLLQTFVLIVSVAGVLNAQRAPITIVSPAGLVEPPFEVAAGTSVIFKVDFNGVTPTFFFSSPTEPVLDNFSTDPSWGTYSNFKNNGDGTFSQTLVVNRPIYVWAGFYDSFMGWNFSEVIAASIASGVELSYPKGFLCSTGTNSEVLSVKGTYGSYQWYRDSEPIPGATTATYTATTEGAYKVQVPLSGNNVFSNTLHLRNATVDFTGALSGTSLTLKASGGMDSYTWLSGTSESSLSEISTNTTYTTTVVAQTKYYALKAVKSGCEIQTAVRAASTAIFATPVISVSAQANSQGKICLGTEATLSVPNNYATYLWFVDGNNYFSDTHTTTTTDRIGNFRTDVTPTGWPEITLSSANKKVGYYNMTAPSLTSTDNGPLYCPGKSIKETLDDEGYVYTWYLHKNPDYTEADKVTPSGYAFTFTFSEPTNLTLVGKNVGCEIAKTYNFQSYKDVQPSLAWVDEYLCSSLDLTMNDADQYTGFQWYKNSQPLTGETAATLTVTETGSYYVTAHPTSCPASTNSTEVKEIYANTERPLVLSADKDAICEGEKATLQLPPSWTNVQWFEKKIKIAQQGYTTEYVPIEGVGDVQSLEVSKYTTYMVKAKYEGCPEGIKIWSEPFQIRPAINPNIKVGPGELEPKIWRPALFDSIPDYVFCADAPVSMTVDSEVTYDSYEWFVKAYGGDDKYTVGDKVTDASSDHLDIQASGAHWYTAKVTSGNCVSYSDPVLIDLWVHNTPDVASIGNSELCGEGDDLKLWLGFPGNWVKLEWYDQGELVPNSDNDTLVVTRPGSYVVVGYPEECPNIGYSSGIPVDVKYFEPAVIHDDEEDIIYVTPWEGYYTFNWYLDGKPLTVVNNEDDSGPLYTTDTNNDPEDDPDPAGLYKRRMRPGVYTVTVTNFEDCSSTAAAFTWTTLDPGADPDPVTGIGHEEEYIGFAIHPNPTDGSVTLKGPAKDQIKTVGVTSIHGQPVPAYFSAADQSLDLSSLPAGVYVVEITLTNNSKKSLRVLRK